MKIGRIHFLMLLAVTGYTALAVLSPRFDPSIKWDYRLDRPATIGRAQEAASS